MLFLEALKLIFLLVFVFFFHLELKCQILLGVFVKKMNFYFIPKYPKFDIMVLLVIFFGFFWERDAILNFTIKSS